MIKGKIYLLESFGTIDGPEIHFVVFTQGCPLRCLYCHNPDTQNLKRKVKYQTTSDELLTGILRYESFIAHGGVTVTGGGPLLRPEFLKKSFRLCQKQGLHTALGTSGFVYTSKAWEALDCANLMLLDIKTLNPDLHPLLADVRQDSISLLLDELRGRGIDTRIHHTIAPGYTDNNEWLEALARYISSYKAIRRVELLPYHTIRTYKYEQLGPDYSLRGMEPLPKERLGNTKMIFSRYKPEDSKARSLDQALRLCSS